MLSSSLPFIFAQVTNAASSVAGAAGTAGVDPSQQGPPAWTSFLLFGLLLAMVYFGLLRPQMQQKKKQEDTVKGARTGDKIVTTGGIYGVITNVKDTTVILRIADNVKIELDKAHIDKITRAETADSKTDSKPDKTVAAKAS